MVFIHMRVSERGAINAYDDLPPLSLAALGSPIWTIYSSRKPMRIQSCWSLCPRRVVFLQKLYVHSSHMMCHFFYEYLSPLNILEQIILNKIKYIENEDDCILIKE